MSPADRTDADLLVVSHSGDRAGAPMVVLRFLRWLRQHTDLDVEVLLLHGGSMEDQFAEFGARVVGGGGSRLWMLQKGLVKLGFKRVAAALAYARLGPPLWANRSAPFVLLNSIGSLPALQFLPDRGQGVVLYVHEMDEGFNRTLGRTVWERHSPRVDHFLSCSSGVTEMLVERAGVPPSRVTCLHGFIDPPAVDAGAGERVREELGIPPGAFVVGACGRPDWRKAPEVFVRVADSLVRHRPDLDLHFVWIGGPMHDSPYYKLRHDVDAAGLGDRLHLVDETPRPHDYMSALDVFCLTSREDPFPLSMLEAGALGKPVVSFANGGVTELGGDGSLARIVPYLAVGAMVEAVSELLDDPARRAEEGGRLRDHVLANHVTDVAAPALFDTLAGLNPELRVKRPAAPATAPD